MFRIESPLFEGEDGAGGSGSPASDPTVPSAPSSEAGANVQTADSPTDQVQGEQQQGDEGSDGDSIAELRAALEERGIDPATVAKGLLNGAAPEAIEDTEAAREIARKAVEKDRQQAREQEQALRQRTEAFMAAETAGGRSAQTLINLTQQIDQLRDDPDQALQLITKRNAQGGYELIDHLNDIVRGVTARHARENSTAMAELRDKHKDVLGELTAAEEQTLRDARYQSARTGGLEEFEALLTVYGERIKQASEQKGEEKGRRKAVETKEAVNGLKEVAQILRGLPPKTKGAKPAPHLDAVAELERDMQSIDVTTPAGRDEWERRKPEFDRRRRALTK